MPITRALCITDYTTTTAFENSEQLTHLLHRAEECSVSMFLGKATGISALDLNPTLLSTRGNPTRRGGCWEWAGDGGVIFTGAGYLAGRWGTWFVRVCTRDRPYSLFPLLLYSIVHGARTLDFAYGTKHAPVVVVVMVVL